MWTIPAGYGYADAYGDYGAARARAQQCERYRRARKEALRQMWRTPIFTKQRVQWEKLANEYARRLKACEKKQTGGASFKMPADLKGGRQGRNREASAPAEGALAPVPPPPASGPPTALLVGGGLAILLVGVLLFSGSSGGAGSGASPARARSFAVRRPVGGARVAR